MIPELLLLAFIAGLVFGLVAGYRAGQESMR